MSGGVVSEWQWTNRMLYTLGRCGLAYAHVDRRDDGWHAFVQVPGVCVQTETRARLPLEWSEQGVRAWCERWVAAQEQSVKEAES